MTVPDSARPRPPLTPVEDELFRFLIDFLAEHTYQPSVREIGKALRIPSTKSVADLLTSLSSKGYVRKAPGRSRGLSLVGFAGALGTMPVPVMEVDPASGEMRVEDHVTLDRRLVAAPDAFLVRALPDGAPTHAIEKGDLAIVHPSVRARDGDLVAVRMGPTLALRPLTHRGSTIVLGPTAESARETALGRSDDFAVLGVVAGVIRAALRPATG